MSQAALLVLHHVARTPGILVLEPCSLASSFQAKFLSTGVYRNQLMETKATVSKLGALGSRLLALDAAHFLTGADLSLHAYSRANVAREVQTKDQEGLSLEI